MFLEIRPHCLNKLLIHFLLSEGEKWQKLASTQSSQKQSAVLPHGSELACEGATAYRNMGREEEWRAYLPELLDRHQRKHKLVPMLGMR